MEQLDIDSFIENNIDCSNDCLRLAEELQENEEDLLSLDRLLHNVFLR